MKKCFNFAIIFVIMACSFSTLYGSEPTYEQQEKHDQAVQCWSYYQQGQQDISDWIGVYNDRSDDVDYWYSLCESAGATQQQLDQFQGDITSAENELSAMQEHALLVLSQDMEYNWNQGNTLWVDPTWAAAASAYVGVKNEWDNVVYPCIDAKITHMQNAVGYMNTAMYNYMALYWELI